MKKQKKTKVQEVIDADNNIDENIISDVNGSYTGKPLNGDEPLQDADDLQHVPSPFYYAQNYVQRGYP